MLTGILNKPTNIDKGQDNFITLDRDALLADVVANKDIYFHQLSRWTQVLITYESDSGNQLNHLEFNPQDGAFPIANFNPSSTARNNWEVQIVMIRDLDNGEVIYCRNELDTAHFDITITAADIQSVSIQSNNVDQTIAVQGDTVTVNIQAQDDIFNVAATISGQPTVISGSGTTRTISRVMTGVEPQGNVPFNITYEDSNSNSYGPVTSTTDSSSVDFDSVLPQLPSVTIYSNNIDIQKAVTGDTVTIDFTSDEPISQVVTTILGNIVTSNNISGNNWRAQYVVQASDNGLINFTIKFEDNNQNIGIQVTSTTDSSEVTITNDKPELSLVNIASNNSNNDFADVGDSVYLVVRSLDQSITFNSVNILSNQVTMVYQGQVGSEYQWNGEYVVQNGDPEGIVTFSIDFENSLGVDGDQVTNTTNASSVEILNQTLLSYLNIQSDNTDITLSEPGNNVTVSLSTLESITNVECRMKSTTRSATNISGNNWEVSFSHSELEFDGQPDKLYNSLIVNYDQLIPNNQQYNTTDGSFVIVNTPPTLLDYIYSSNNKYNDLYLQNGDTLTLTITTSETVITPTATFYGNQAIVTGSGNSWTIEYIIQPGDTRGPIIGSIDLEDQLGLQSNNITLFDSIEIVDLVPLGLQGTKVTSTSQYFYVADLSNVREYYIQTGTIGAGWYYTTTSLRDISAAGDNMSFISGAGQNNTFTQSSGSQVVSIDPNIVGTSWENQVPTTNDGRIVLLNNSQGIYTPTHASVGSWSSPFNLPSVKQYIGVVWGNSTWVSVSTTGYVITSTNGTSWANSANLTSSSIFSIKYINNQFVIISDSKTWTSTNGVSWTERSIPFNTWIDITYGNGKYIAVADGSYTPGRSKPIATSTDLINWTEITIDKDTSFRSIEYNIANNVILIVGLTTNSAEITSLIGIL